MNPADTVPSGTLYVVSTPIGNLEDMTFRAIRVLKEVDIIAAEDTRVTAKLSHRYDIGTRLVSIRGEGAQKNAAFLIEQLLEGKNVAIVTDAGTPSVSDPGAELVGAAYENGILVSPIPGASALAAAVSVAGLQGDGVRFLGFLPIKGRRRTEIIASIRTENALTVLYESPRRIGETLADLASVCGERRAAVMRELTKIHEEITRDTLVALSLKYSEDTMGEVTVAVEGVRSGETEEGLSEDELRTLIVVELQSGRSVKDTAAALSKGFGLPRKSVYDLAVTVSSSLFRDEK
jgi:16S rRNA (cytidine1402-2'-O)-methyltransferase